MKDATLWPNPSVVTCAVRRYPEFWGDSKGEKRRRNNNNSGCMDTSGTTTVSEVVVNTGILGDPRIMCMRDRARSSADGVMASVTLISYGDISSVLGIFTCHIPPEKAMTFPSSLVERTNEGIT